jgi:mono/diheme cytochrome c family protein
LQLAKQHDDVDSFMKSPFEPELAGSSLAAANVALANPLATKGKDIFEQQGCNACHGDGGSGTAAAPKLVGVGDKYPGDKLLDLLHHPTAKMTNGGMPPITLNDDDLKALLAYLQSLK